MKIDLRDFLKAFERSLESNNSDLHRLACETIIQLSHAVKSTFCVISPHIIQILNKASNISKSLYFMVLRKINENVGISSNIYKEFNNYSRQLIDFLNHDPENEVFLFYKAFRSF